MEELRDYQHEALIKAWQSLHTHGRALICLPCGVGKTVIFKHLIKQMDVKTLVLFSKVDLVRQSAKVIGDSCGVYCSTLNKRELHKKVVCASVQSVKKLDLSEFKLVVIDEVHNFNQDKGEYLKIAQLMKAKVAGFTATPFNPSGYIYGRDKFFPEVTYQKPLKYFFENKYLVIPTMKASNEQFDTSKLKIRMGEYDSKSIDLMVSDVNKAIRQVEDALPRIKDRKKVVWACCNISHATIIQSILKSKEETATIIHSKLNQEQRDSNLASFERGTTKHLVFVTIVSEGYDYPAIDTVILLRPTRSPRLYVQTVGRGLRLSEGKESCLVLDYGKVIAELGPIDKPAVFDRARGGPTKQRQILMKFCKGCLEYVPLATTICPECDYEFIQEKSYDKNLTTMHESGSILSGEVMRDKISRYVISDYVSKNGNRCKMISYYTDLMSPPIKEYFLETADYAMKKYKKRIYDLGLDNEKFIRYKKEGKYFNVIGLDYDRKRVRE